MDNQDKEAPVDRRSFLRSASRTAALVASGSSAAPQSMPQQSSAAALSPAGQGMRIPVINPKDYTPKQELSHSRS